MVFGVLGIFLVSIALFFAILYTNLFAFGYSFLNYVYFINSRIEFLVFYVGVLFGVLGFFFCVCCVRVGVGGGKSFYNNS